MIGLLLGLGTASAGEYVVGPGTQPEVPLNTDVGTVVQLPEAVQLVPQTAYVIVEPLRAQGPAPAAKGKNQPKPKPVQHLRVRLPVGQAGKPETVTFVLASGKSIPVRFVPTSPTADAFASIQWERPASKNFGHTFLAEERALMERMFADDPFRRELVDERWRYDAYPQLEWHLIRRHRGMDGLVGYTIVLTLLDNKEWRFDPTVLAIGRPNRVVLSQIDAEHLAPERAIKKAERKGYPSPGVTTTVLRLVVREAGQEPTPVVHIDHEMPFLSASAPVRRR